MKTGDIWELTTAKIRHFAKDSLVTVCIFAIAFGSFCFILNIPKHIEKNSTDISNSQLVETNLIYESPIPLLPNSEKIESYNLAFRVKRFGDTKLDIEQLDNVSFVSDIFFEQNRYFEIKTREIPVLSNNAIDPYLYGRSLFESKRNILSNDFKNNLQDFISNRPNDIKSFEDIVALVPDEISAEPEGVVIMQKLMDENNQKFNSYNIQTQKFGQNVKFVGFFENYIGSDKEQSSIIPSAEQLPINPLVFRMSDKQYFAEYLRDPKISYLVKYDNFSPAVYQKSKELIAQGISSWVIKTPRNWIINRLKETFRYTFPLIFGTSGFVIAVILLILLAMTVGKYSKNWAICDIFGLKLLDKLKLQFVYFGLLGAVGLGLGYILGGALLYFTMDFWQELLIKDMMNYATNYAYKPLFVYDINLAELGAMYFVIIVISLVLSLKKYNLNK